MTQSRYLLLAACLADVVFTTPSLYQRSSEYSGEGGFSVSQVRNERFNLTVKERYNAVFNKYGIPKPGPLADGIEQRETGSVVATPSRYDAEYVIPVSIDGQVLYLDADSGSADFWTFSKLLPVVEQLGHTNFDPSHASDFRYLEGYSWSITYGDGSGASGVVGTAPVDIGGATATSQAVELATSVTGSLALDTNIDGIVGFAFDNINQVRPVPQKTFFLNILESLPQPVFTANLKHQEPGQYNFGYIDSSEYNGQLIWTPVDKSDGYWEITASGYAVGSGTFNNQQITDVIVDTGTSLALLHQSIVSDYWSHVPGSYYSLEEEGILFPCSATLPDLIIGIGSSRVKIQGEYMNYAPIEDGYCYGGLQNIGSSTELSILGDVFFKSNFVVFDVGINNSQPQLAFGAKY